MGLHGTPLRWTLALGLALGLAAGARADEPPPLLGLVLGVAGDETRPLAGVEVEVLREATGEILARTLTGGDGRFALPRGDPEPRVLVLRRDGYLELRRPLGPRSRGPFVLCLETTSVPSPWEPLRSAPPRTPRPGGPGARPTPLVVPWGTRAGTLEREALCSAPLSTGRNNGLHNVILLPVFEGADLRPRGHFDLDYRYEVTSTLARGSDEHYRAELDGRYFEQVVTGRLGLTDSLELHGELPWASREGQFRIARDGVPLLPPGPADLQLGDPVLGAKASLWRDPGGRAALAASAQAKLPAGSTGEFLSSGSPDGAASAHATLVAGPLGLQGQAGYVVVGEVQSFSAAGTRTKDVLHWALGAAWPRLPDPEFPVTLFAHLVGNTNAFAAIRPIDSDLRDLQGGLRASGEHLQVELGVGRGILSPDSSNWSLGSTVRLHF